MLLAGLLLGLASTLHCAGMCGGIAASLMLLPGHSLWRLQAARIAAYALQGALVGGLGTLVYARLHWAPGFLILRLAAALALFWIGLGVAGILPAIALLDRLAARVSAALARLGPFAGLAWGALPCAMVWSALLSAMLAGNARGGAITMLGFGLGTLPGVSAAAVSALGLRGAARRQNWRLAIGLLIAAAAPLSLLLAPGSAMLCLVP